MNSPAVEQTLDPRRFTLDTVAEAHEAMTDRSATGKIVVEIAQ